jgi:starch phosphorylase
LTIAGINNSMTLQNDLNSNRPNTVIVTKVTKLAFFERVFFNNKGYMANNQTKTVQSPASESEDVRTGLGIASLRQAFRDNLYYRQGRDRSTATLNDFYMAAAYAVRDRLMQRWMNTVRKVMQSDTKVVCYFSAEFLTGPHLGNNLINLGIYDQVEHAFLKERLPLSELRVLRLYLERTGKKLKNEYLSLPDILDQEEEPGLGNGGLGRLAACFMDSLSTLEIPAIGYGIRYEFGIFDQIIRDGWQVEITDKWLNLGNPWELARPELALNVKLGGHTERYYDNQGKYRVRWVPATVIRGIPYETPVPGFRVDTCNTLRLWSAHACESFDFQAFNKGDYYSAVSQKVFSENITKVLYPNDESFAGKQLRLEQQYFFVSCSLQDMIRTHLFLEGKLENFHERFAVQLNDTHPSIGIAELMRLLVDEYAMYWDQAWHITQQTFAYTNHTLLPEALEKWPLLLFGQLLPRHLEIILEINRRFLDQISLTFPGDAQRLARLSLIEENGEKYVRMANLACVGSHAINGVAELHSELLKHDVLADFYALTPEKFHNVTNGVTPRRFMALINPRLTALINDRIGTDWLTDLTRLRQLEAYADDGHFQSRWREVKSANKRDLADYIFERTGIKVNPDTLFDIQVKRLHEYKRQHLKLLYIVTLYRRIRQNPNLNITPRTFIFGGKAAPGYHMAKLIIKLINSVAGVVNNDAAIEGRIKVIFVPDYNVKNSQKIYPAADLSEQISLAGKEASGTGNMKFAMNGALTIGTLDGANIEIREEAGAENFFLFGLTAEQVKNLKSGGYNPQDYYRANTDLRASIDLINSGHFSGGDRELFRPLIDSLLYRDEYLLFADFQSYLDCQDSVDRAYKDSKKWTRMSILNVARSGKFSSDRSIRDYCAKIWNISGAGIPLPNSVENFPLKSAE